MASNGADGIRDDSRSFSDSEETKWTTLAISHVEYPQGDWLGNFMAVSSLSPLVILVGFVTLIIFRRDLHTITFFCGTLLNEAVNWVLKHIIRESRPCRGREVLFTEYGMPSSHSQFMWFFATYVAFFMLIRLHQISNSSFMDNAWKYFVTLCVFWSALTVSYGRVYLQYHTWTQVVSGALLGGVLGCLWFAVMQLILTPLFPMVALWPICEFLMIRDSTLIPNVMWFEYTNHRSEARTRQRKLVKSQ
uniref:Dolichyldiphosphatase n=1 Tax=Strigamia maritima TaxID=126957 RepID=T1IY84_STRMM